MSCTSRSEKPLMMMIGVTACRWGNGRMLRLVLVVRMPESRAL